VNRGYYISWLLDSDNSQPDGAQSDNSRIRRRLDWLDAFPLDTYHQSLASSFAVFPLVLTAIQLEINKLLKHTGDVNGFASMDHALSHNILRLRTQLQEIVCDYNMREDDLYYLPVKRWKASGGLSNGLLVHFVPVKSISTDHPSGDVLKPTIQTCQQVCYALEALAFIRLHQSELVGRFNETDTVAVQDSCNWNDLLDLSARVCSINFRGIFTPDQNSNIAQIHALLVVVNVLEYCIVQKENSIKPSVHVLRWIKPLVMSKKGYAFQEDIQSIMDLILVPTSFQRRSLKRAHFPIHTMRLELETVYRLSLMRALLEDMCNGDTLLSEAECRTMGVILTAIGDPIQRTVIGLGSRSFTGVRDLASKVFGEPGRSIWMSRFGYDVNKLMLDLEKKLSPWD